MADKVYPSGKPPTVPAAANGTFPATKSQLYGQTRSAYRLPATTTKKSKHKRNCCCSCCLWSTVAILVLLFLIGVAGAVFYILYRPHHPTFTVSSLKVSTLNITSQLLTTKVNLNVTTRNPNKKLTFLYSPITVTLLTTSDGVVLGTGSVPGFVHGTKNTTLLDFAVSSNGQALDDTSAGKLKADLKSKSGLGLTLKLDTKVKVKLGGLKLPKVGIRVTCDGIKVSVPSGKVATTASAENSKCKVDLRFKIWKWTF